MKEAAETAAVVDDIYDSNAHTRKMLEKEHHGTLATAEEIAELGYEDFLAWMGTIVPYENFKNSVLFFKLPITDPIDLTKDDPIPRVKVAFSSTS